MQKEIVNNSLETSSVTLFKELSNKINISDNFNNSIGKNSFKLKFKNKLNYHYLQLILLIIFIIGFLILLIFFILFKNKINVLNSINNNQQQELKKKDDIIYWLKDKNKPYLYKENEEEYTQLLNSIKNLRKKFSQEKTLTDVGLSLAYLTAPRQVIGKKKIRVGNNGDGGYVLLDDFTNIKIAYSLGLSNMIDFDRDLANRGIDVYMYDHTIENLTYENPKFHWKKKGMCSKSTKKPNLMTLTEMLKENGHMNENNMLLKIDVENAEWDALNELPDEILEKFTYIVGEFHLIKEMVRKKTINLALNVLKKLNKNHQIFHKHVHNSNLVTLIGEFQFYSAMELSLVKKQGNSFKNDYSIYPIDGLDFDDKPNCKIKQLFLGMSGLYSFE